MHERKRKKDLQKGIWKGQEIKKIDLSLEEKKNVWCQNTEAWLKVRQAGKESNIL